MEGDINARKSLINGENTTGPRSILAEHFFELERARQSNGKD